MEYYLARAFNVPRLSYEELISLHIKETNIKRPLMPYEIQACFHIPEAKQAYFLPDNESAQSSFIQKIREQFRKENLIPRGGDLPNDVSEIHEWDHRLTEAINALKIDLVYHVSRSRSRRATEEVENNT